MAVRNILHSLEEAGYGFSLHSPLQRGFRLQQGPSSWDVGGLDD